jgi:hypothetical protein
MADAYVPGLTVAEGVVIRRARRLPLPGQVLVRPGERVAADQVVARALVPGDPHAINVAHALGVPPADVPRVVCRASGEPVRAGQVLAEVRGVFGLGRRRLLAPVGGTVELVSGVTGQVTLRSDPLAVEVRAHLSGVVAEVLPGEGAVVETVGALVQGIFGVGGERRGRLRHVAAAHQVLDRDAIPADAAGCVLTGGALITPGGLERAAEVGVSGVVVGGIADTDLERFVGRDVGVAVTGQEAVPFTLILTEGFGRIPMAEGTLRLLRRLEGREAAISGATQIRAGVLRPELVVPLADPGTAARRQAPGHGRDRGALPAPGLVPGGLVRLIREPFFGVLADVVELPAEPEAVETEARVRVVRVRLRGPGGARGPVVTVPRANVEVVAAGT